MTTNNKCNHAEAIAEDLYNTYAIAKDLSKRQPMLKYADLPDDDKAGWLAVAHQALPTIAAHAMDDMKLYLIGQAKTSTGWKKALYWAGSIIAAGLALIGLSSLSGCGHDVSITPDHTEICKNGSCLVLDKNGQSITYRQNAPEPPASAEQAPVVIKQEK